MVGFFRQNTCWRESTLKDALRESAPYELLTETLAKRSTSCWSEHRRAVVFDVLVEVTFRSTFCNIILRSLKGCEQTWCPSISS